jgi:predicted amidohydrolase YtcJ
MDTIFYNGIIHTMRGREVVCALAVKNGLIRAVGSDAEILALQKPHTVLVDLEKKLMIPGFNDSHMHLLSYALHKRRLNLAGCRSATEMIERGRDYLAKNPAAGPLVGRGWNQDHFLTPAFPRRQDLDTVSGGLPLIFYRVCGHIAVINSQALKYFGIGPATKCPQGGSFDPDSGLFCENALDLLALPAPGPAEIKGLIKEAARDLLKQGITSVQSDDFGQAKREDIVRAYSELAQANELPIRIYQQCLFDKIEDISRFLAKKLQLPPGQAFYRLGPIKLLSDGSLGARTAYLSRPYHDDPSTQGIACFTQAELDAIVALCHESGWATAIHCIGDGAAYRTAASIEKARQSSGGAGLRHGIVHCQISDKPLLEKMKELELLAYIQPIFLDYDIHIVEQRVGADLARTSYQFKALHDLGVPIALGSDCPVEPFDPLPNIYCAVTRKDLRGYPPGGFNAGQALSVYEAVQAYTAGSAYCSYEENVKGQLAPGFYADMAVLDRDIFSIKPEEIRDASVVMTVVAGKIQYVAESMQCG